MSKTAADYLVTTPYGQIAGYPLNNGFHRGEDRACPSGTPVVVNGLQVGLVGTTGASTGPHLHLGRFVSGAPTHPKGRGFVLSPSKVLNTGEDSVSGKFVRVRDKYGTIWFYCHLSKITCQAGDTLEVNDMYKGKSAKYWYEEYVNAKNGYVKAGRIAESRLNVIRSIKDFVATKIGK